MSLHHTLPHENSIRQPKHRHPLQLNYPHPHEIHKVYMHPKLDQCDLLHAAHKSKVRGEECAATAMLAKCHTERLRLLNILHGRLNLWPRPLSSEVKKSQPGR